MSPTGPLVFALSLLLISETAEAEETMDPFTLIRKTLKYWRTIYKEYNDEVILGYCWAEYVLGVNDGTSSPPISRATFQNHSDVQTAGYDQTKAEIIDEDTVLSRKRMENWTSQEVKVRRKRSRGTLNSTDRKEDIRMDPQRRIARNIGELFAEQFPNSDTPSKTPVTWMERELYGGDSRYTLRDLTSTEHPQDTFRHSYRSSEFSRIGGHASSSFSLPFYPLSPSSREKLRTSHDGRLSNRDAKIVKRLSHLKFEGNGAEDARKLRGRSEDLEADIHRKVLYRKMSHATFNDDDSSVGRMFSLKLSRGEQQKSLRSRSRSVPTEDTFLNDFRFKKYNRRILEKVKENGFPDVGRTADSYGPEFQVWKEASKYSQRKTRFKRDTKISKGKSSGESSLARNLTFSARQSSNTLLTIVTNILKLLRSLLNAFSHFISRRTDSQLPLENPEDPNRAETYSNHPHNFNQKYLTYQDEQIHRQLEDSPRRSTATTTNENRRQKEFFTENSREMSALKEPRQREKSIQSPMRISSLLPVMYQQFMEDYDSWTRGTNRNPRASRSSRLENQSGESLSFEGHKSTRTFVSNIHSLLSGILRTLGLFVQVGRQIMDYVETNRILGCTKDYVWTKVILWIDS